MMLNHIHICRYTFIILVVSICVVCGCDRREAPAPPETSANRLPSTAKEVPLEIKSTQVDSLNEASFHLVEPEHQLQSNCYDQGLVTDNECEICHSQADHQCVKISTLQSGEGCFECQQTKSVEIDCAEKGLLVFSECNLCQSISNASCVSSNKQKGCYECIEREKVCEYNDMMSLEVCQLLIKEQGGKCIKENLYQSQSELLCYRHQTHTISVPKSEPLKTCSSLGYLTIEGCSQCEEQDGFTCVAEALSDTGKQCYSCQEAAHTCKSFNQVRKEECVGCADCIEGKVLENGQKCYQCIPEFGAVECLEEGYLQNCNTCNRNETCEKLGIVLFYGKERSPLLTCYQCI